MNGWGKRIKKNAFSCRNGLVWTVKNKNFVFCFVFFETKTEILKPALVWSGSDLKPFIIFVLTNDHSLGNLPPCGSLETSDMLNKILLCVLSERLS